MHKHAVRRLAAIISAAGLCLTAVTARATIVNPSFEADGTIADLSTANATGWADNVASPFGGDVRNIFFHSNGQYGARLYSKADGTFSAGNSVSVYQQNVDLTGVAEILFDAKLSAHGGAGTWNSFLQASFYVDATPVWSSQSSGTYYNQSIDTSLLTGVHTLGFKLEAIGPGAGGNVSSWFEFDNLRAIPEPSALGLMTLGGLAAFKRRRHPA